MAKHPSNEIVSKQSSIGGYWHSKCKHIDEWNNGDSGKQSQIASSWGPPGSCRPQMDPMLAPRPLLSGLIKTHTATYRIWCCLKCWRQNQLASETFRSNLYCDLMGWLNVRQYIFWPVLCQIYLTSFIFPIKWNCIKLQLSKVPFSRKKDIDAKHTYTRIFLNSKKKLSYQYWHQSWVCSKVN